MTNIVLPITKFVDRSALELMLADPTTEPIQSQSKPSMIITITHNNHFRLTSTERCEEIMVYDVISEINARHAFELVAPNSKPALLVTVKSSPWLFQEHPRAT